MSKLQFNRVMALIEAGKKEGATLAIGGMRHGSEGYFIQEVIKRANDTTYGLAAGVLTNDINKALAFSQAVNAGTVW